MQFIIYYSLSETLTIRRCKKFKSTVITTVKTQQNANHQQIHSVMLQIASELSTTWHTCSSKSTLSRLFLLTQLVQISHCNWSQISQQFSVQCSIRSKPNECCSSVTKMIVQGNIVNFLLQSKHKHSWC